MFELFDKKNLTRREVIWILYYIRDNKNLNYFYENITKSYDELIKNLNNFPNKKEQKPAFQNAITQVKNVTFIDENKVNWIFEDYAASLWLTQMMQTAGLKIIDLASKQEVGYQLEYIINFENLKLDKSILYVENYVMIENRRIFKELLLNPSEQLTDIEEKIAYKINAIHELQLLWQSLLQLVKKKLGKKLSANNKIKVNYAYDYLQDRYADFLNEKFIANRKKVNVLPTLINFYPVKDKDNDDKYAFIIANLAWLIYLNKYRPDLLPNFNLDDFFETMFDTIKRTSNRQKAVISEADRTIKLSVTNYKKLSEIAKLNGLTLPKTLDTILKYIEVRNIPITSTQEKPTKKKSSSKRNQSMEDVKQPYSAHWGFGNSLKAAPTTDKSRLEELDSVAHNHTFNLTSKEKTLSTDSGNVLLEDFHITYNQETEQGNAVLLETEENKNTKIEPVIQGESATPIEDLENHNDTYNEVNAHESCKKIHNNNLIDETKPVQELTKTSYNQLSKKNDILQIVDEKSKNISTLDKPFFIFHHFEVNIPDFAYYRQIFEEYLVKATDEEKGVLSLITLSDGRKEYIFELYANEEGYYHHKHSQVQTDFFEKLKPLLINQQSTKFIKLNGELLVTSKISIHKELAVRWHYFKVKSELNNEFKKKIFDIKNSYSNLIINRLGIYAMQREFMDDTAWYILEFYLDDYSKNKSNDYIDKFEQDNSRLILDSGNRYCGWLTLSNQYDLNFENHC